MPQKKSTTKKSSTSKRITKKQQEALNKTRAQLFAVIMFAVGILYLALAFVEGESAWYFLHNVLFGLFGAGNYIVGFVIIGIAWLSTKATEPRFITSKLWQGGVLMLMLCSAIHIFTIGLPSGDGFFSKIAEFYLDGVDKIGGGVVGAILGWPISTFGEVPAKVTIIVLTILFVMILTGVTLVDVFATVKKPVKKIEQAYIDQLERNEVKRAEQEKAKPKEKAKTKFNVDVSLGPDVELPEHPVQATKPKTQKEEVAKELSQPTPPPAEEVDVTPEPEQPPRPVAQPLMIDDIIKNVTTTVVPKPEVAEPEVEENDNLLDFATFKNRVNEQNGEEDTAIRLIDTENVSEVQDTADYQYPPLNLLNPPVQKQANDATAELNANAELLVDTLKSFGVHTKIVGFSRGPTVTRYELQPSAGVKISKITGLADDIALNLAAAGVRIEAPIPGKAAVGIEVPNKSVSSVNISEIVGSTTFKSAKSKLTMALGRDISGEVIVGDIAKMPHMLIAGATGSGKSVCINSIILSLLYKSTPDEVRLLMVDPKVVELGVYNGIPHLLVPVVTDPHKAAGALNWAVSEMLKRYKMFADNGVRDLSGFNEMAKESETLSPMPQIVIIIDELADLMMAAPNEVEDAICRLAQMARAAGMHLIIATQRPSVDVITGVIKANIPSRISFAVSSQVDSRTILDQGGAEKLLGKGDMLYYPQGSPKPTRIQGCFVSDKEVEKVTTFIKQSVQTEYDETVMDEIEKQSVKEKGSNASASDGGGFDTSDEMLPKAIECVIEAGQASTSLLQRKLKLGYARAARIIDEMEERGIIGAFEGAKPRPVLITRQQWIEMTMQNTDE